MMLLTLALAASVNHVIAVGDPAVDGTRIVPYVTEWNVTITTPDGRTADGGVWRDRVRLVDYKGRKVLLREQIQDTPPPRTSELISVWVDPATLRPIASQTQVAGGAWYRSEFAGESMTTAEVEPEKELALVTHTRKLERAPFDFYGGLFGILLAAMPLEAGHSYTFPAYNENDEPPLVTMTTADVVREETIDSGYLGRLKVKVVRLNAIHDVQYTFWIADTAPYIIKLELKGPRGGKLTWTLPDRRPTA